MRQNKPLKLYIPDRLYVELNQYIIDNSPEFSYKIEYFYFLLHYLIEKKNRYRDYEFHSINMEKMKAITASNLDRYIKFLKNGEFILSDNKYMPGNKKLWYAIAPKYQSGVKEIQLETGTRLYKNIRKQQQKQKAHYNRLEPYLKCMKEKFFRLELMYDEAYNWVNHNVSEVKRVFYYSSINSIEDNPNGRYFKRNKTNNRLDTNLTNLKSELRQFIVGDYVSIDLKNSQPFFLTLLINQILNNNIIDYPLCCYFFNYNPVETFGKRAIQKILLKHQKQKNADMVNLRRFMSTTKSGVFYDSFVETYQGNVSRAEIKDIMFKVLFSHNETYFNYKKRIPYREEKETFNTQFPFIYYVCKVLKEKDHALLAITLQRMESLIFIDNISKELVSQNIVPLTIHDSIIVERKDQQQTLNIMQQIFKQHCGIIPSFHVKNL